MKAADWLVRGVTAATFFVLLIAPDKYGAAMVFISLIVTGAWVILYPQGVLGWLKATHPAVDAEDASVWWDSPADRLRVSDNCCSARLCSLVINLDFTQNAPGQGF